MRAYAPYILKLLAVYLSGYIAVLVVVKCATG